MTVLQSNGLGASLAALLVGLVFECGMGGTLMQKTCIWRLQDVFFKRKLCACPHARALVLSHLRWLAGEATGKVLKQPHWVLKAVRCLYVSMKAGLKQPCAKLVRKGGTLVPMADDARHPDPCPAEITSHKAYS